MNSQASKHLRGLWGKKAFTGLYSSLRIEDSPWLAAESFNLKRFLLEQNYEY
jgi:hypothetical protein